jgi:hypothetical protein
MCETRRLQPVYTGKGWSWIGFEQTQSRRWVGTFCFWLKADMTRLFLYSCFCHYHRLRSGGDMRRPERAELVRIANYFCLLVAVSVCSVASLAGLPDSGFMSIALAQSAALTASQSEALNAYNKTVQDFRAILRERRAQIDAKQKLSEKPGQALYLARVAMMGAYKDLTDVMPSRIGRPNKYKIPPAYFDADNEPLIDEYKNLFRTMQAPPASAQASDTPYKDVVDLGTVIARVKGLDAANSEVAGRISLAVFFAETDGNQNIGNARSESYKGSFQTGVSEDKIGRKKWAAIKKSVAVLDPKLNARDDKEEARVGNSDQRYNHWTAVRNGLMNAHADLFPKIPAIMKALPDPIDQMRFFELIQIIPSPAKAALNSGNLLNYRISEPRIMGYLRNNSMFAYGKADRAKTSATMREILDSMWLFNDIFDRALAKFGEIKAQQKG